MKIVLMRGKKITVAANLCTAITILENTYINGKERRITCELHLKFVGKAKMTFTLW